MKRANTCIAVLVTIVATTSWASAGVMYGTGPYNDALYEIDPATGAATLVGAMQTSGGTGFAFPSSLAYSPSGTLYGYSAGLQQFAVVDPGTALVTLLPTVASSTSFISGIAFNAAGDLYAVDESAREMYGVNPVTGELALLGATDESFSGITFGVDDTLYGVTYMSSSLYEISLADYSSTALGDMGFNYIRDLTTIDDAAVSTLGASATPSGGTTLGYVTTSPVGGTTLPNNGVTIDGLAYLGGGPPPPPVPAPGALVAGILGVTLAAAGARLRRGTK